MLDRLFLENNIVTNVAYLHIKEVLKPHVSRSSLDQLSFIMGF